MGWGAWGWGQVWRARVRTRHGQDPSPVLVQSVLFSRCSLPGSPRWRPEHGQRTRPPLLPSDSSLTVWWGPPSCLSEESCCQERNLLRCQRAEFFERRCDPHPKSLVKERYKETHPMGIKRHTSHKRQLKKAAMYNGKKQNQSGLFNQTDMGSTAWQRCDLG